MSALFNQTNIAPGTPFASGGGGSNFPSGIQIGNTVFSPVSGVLTVSNTSGNYDNLVSGPLQVNSGPLSGPGGYTLITGGDGNGVIQWVSPAFSTIQFAAFGAENSAELTNISTLNGQYPSVFSTKEEPGPPKGAITTIGSIIYDGIPTLVEIDPTLYKQKMRVFLTPTTNDGTPDGLYTYNNEGGASLSSFTVSGGTNANVEISYMTIGW